MRPLFRFRRAGWLLLAGLSLTGVAAAQTSGGCTWMTDLAQMEGGGNQYATNNSSTATGLYQTTQAAMQTCGLLTENSSPGSSQFGASGDWSNVSWSQNQFGVTSRASYEASLPAQQYCATKFSQTVWNSSQIQSLTGKIGAEIPGGGGNITQAGLLTCGYIGGPAGCAAFLNNGTTGNAAIDGNIRARMMAQGADDASCVTNQTDTTAYEGGTPDIPPGQANSVAVYCDPNVAQTMSRMGEQTVNNWTALAGTSGAGYSLLGGQGVLQAAGLAASGGSGSSGPFGGSSYAAMSCVDRLMNSSVDIIFAPPSISDLFGLLEQAACNQIENLFATVTAPLDQSLFRNANLGAVGGFLPGVGLGSVGGAVHVTPGGAAETGSPVNIAGGGINPVLQGDTSWYSPTYGSAPLYGSVFGSGGTTSSGGVSSFFSGIFNGQSGSAGSSSQTITPGGLY